MRTLTNRLDLPCLVGVLLVVAVPVRAAEDAPKVRLAEIVAAQKAVRARYLADLKTVEDAARERQLAGIKPVGRTATARAPVMDRFRAETRQNMEAALRLAGANPDDPIALEALMFVIRTNKAGPDDSTARALRLIDERGYARLPRVGADLGHVALLLFQYPDAERLLRRVLDENPDHADRGAACYWLARHLSEQAKMVRMLREKPANLANYERYPAAAPIARFVEEKDPVALDREANALLERVVAEYGDVPMRSARGNLGRMAAGELFAASNLAIGKPVPEIEGTDHEGRTFRLSDFRGKVVVLTFSGNWCGPCLGMYPQERELVARLAGQPFALVSVTTDAEVATLKKSIAEGEITWRCWWDGGMGGPIATRWGVSAFPSIFVLDRAGVIRFKDVRGPALEDAVKSLMGEAASQAPPAK